MSTILVVDDNRDIRESIESILKTSGYNVFTAESGYEGLRIVDDENIDLIISDIMMDRMDGYDFYNAVAEKIKNTSGEHLRFFRNSGRR